MLLTFGQDVYET